MAPMPFYEALTLRHIEYKPDNGYAFVNSAAPGFIGVITGLNSEGLGMGTEVIISMAVRFPDTGASSCSAYELNFTYVAFDLSESSPVLTTMYRIK